MIKKQTEIEYYENVGGLPLKLVNGKQACENK